MTETLKVLIVEDDPDIRLGCEQALQLEGIGVEAVRASAVGYVDHPGELGQPPADLQRDAARRYPVLAIAVSIAAQAVAVGLQQASAFGLQAVGFVQVFVFTPESMGARGAWP